MRACHRGKSEARGTCSAEGAPCEDQLVVHVRSSSSNNNFFEDRALKNQHYEHVRAWPLTCTTNRLSRETLLAMRVAEPSDFSRSHTRIGITTILHNAPQLHYSLHPTHTIRSSPSRGPWERQPLPKSSRTVLVLRCPKGICKKSLLTKIPFHGSHFPDPKI